MNSKIRRISQYTANAYAKMIVVMLAMEGNTSLNGIQDMNKADRKLILQAKLKADKVLEANYVSEAPVKVIDIARNYELLVEEVDLGTFGSRVAGFIDPKNKIIYVNKKDSPQRQAFTVAHELAHWIMHPEKLHSQPEKYAVLYRTPLGTTQSDPIEKQANAFAARLLVPKNILSRHKDDDVSTIAKAFGVSEELIGYRLKHEFNRS